jgi:hypothetical protein
MTKIKRKTQSRIMMMNRTLTQKMIKTKKKEGSTTTLINLKYRFRIPWPPTGPRKNWKRKLSRKA